MESVLKQIYGVNFHYAGEEKIWFEEQKELMKVLDINEQRLKKCLSDEGKEHFEKFFNCLNELSVAENRQQFVLGFRLGGKIVMEILLGEGYTNLV